MKKILGLLFSLTALAQTDSVINGKYFEGRNPESVNYIKNSSCFKGVTNITATNTSATKNTTTPLTSISDCQATLDSATDTLDWSANTLDRSLKGGNCEVGIRYKLTLGSGNTIQLQARINSATVASADLVTSDNGTATVNFPCGDLSNAPSLRIAQTAGSSSQAINVANVYLGAARNIGTVAQAEFVGTVAITGCSAAWSTTSGSYADYSTVTSCSYAVTGNGISAPSTNLPGFRLNGAPGRYTIVASGLPAFIASGGGSTSCNYRMTNGTNNSLENNYLGLAVDHATHEFTFELTQAQNNADFRIQSFRIGGSGSCQTLGSTTFPSYLKIYRFPSSSEIAVSANQQNTDWADYTPTYNTGTWTTNLAKWRRNGSNMEIQLKATNTSAGSGAWTFSIPSVGATINTTAVPTSTIGNWITTHTLNAGPVGGGNYGNTAQFGGACSVYVVSTTATSVLCGSAASSALNASGNAYTDRAAGLGSSAPLAGSSGIVNISFSVPINEWKGMNAPILVGSVTSNSTGAERIERVVFAGASITTACTASPCTIYSQSGSWITSVTRSTTGRYVLNIASGIFSAAPTCVVSGDVALAGFIAGVNRADGNTATAIGISTAATSGYTDGNGTVICQGPR
jgi:hypothetical protein